MTFEAFQSYIKENVLKEWREDADIEMAVVRKNNGIELCGLYIRREEEQISPTIYLDEYYSYYLKGEALEEIITRIREEYEWKISRVADYHFNLEKFEYVRDRIVYRLVNYEKNKEILEDCPHLRLYDLALTSGHASLLKRYTQEVLLLYDSDEAGVRAALRAIPILREAGVNSRVVNLRPYKDPDEFIKNLGAEAFEERLEQASDSFMFRVSIAENEFPMEEPQGQNRFFERCAEMLLELKDELERNLYIEAIVKKYRGQYGISVEDLRKRVNTLALKGTPAERRIQPKKSQEGAPKKKKDSASDQAQKLMLTWIVTYPKIFDKVAQYLTPEDFVVPLYREVAQMLFSQREEGEVNPARLLNSFTDSEEQREVASLFNATIHLETPKEQDQAFADTLLRIKTESLAERNRNWNPTDMAGLQEIIKAKKELEELGRKRRDLHISFE